MHNATQPWLLFDLKLIIVLVSVQHADWIRLLLYAGKQVVCALQTHQPALKGVGVGAAGIPEAEVPMLRFKV